MGEIEGKQGKTTKRKAGRPKFQYTEKQLQKIDRLAKENHKTYTIAAAMGLNEETMKTYLSERLAQKRAEGKIELKKAQIDKAIKGKDSTMLVWLGKNDLEQSDKANIVHGVTSEVAELIKQISPTKGMLPNDER